MENKNRYCACPSVARFSSIWLDNSEKTENKSRKMFLLFGYPLITIQGRSSPIEEDVSTTFVKDMEKVKNLCILTVLCYVWTRDSFVSAFVDKWKFEHVFINSVFGIVL